MLVSYHKDHLMSVLRKHLGAALERSEAEGHEEDCALIRLLFAVICEGDRIAFEKDQGLMSDEAIQSKIRDMLRHREANMLTYEQSGHLDMVEAEQRERDLLLSFLPDPLSEEEIERIILENISHADGHSLKDIGSVMTVLRSHYTGRFDFERAALLARKHLSHNL